MQTLFLPQSQTIPLSQVSCFPEHFLFYWISLEREKADLKATQADKTNHFASSAKAKKSQAKLSSAGKEILPT